MKQIGSDFLEKETRIMRRRRLKRNKGLWITVVFVILVVIGSGVFIALNPTEFKSFADRHKTHSIIHSTEEYNIHVKYPSIDNEDFDKKIKNMMDEYVEDFKKKVDAHGKIENFKHELNIYYKTYHLNELSTIKFIVHVNVGKNITETYEVLYFDKKSEKEVLFSDLFYNPGQALNALEKIAREKLIHDSNHYSKANLDKALEIKEASYEILLFDEKHLILEMPNSRLGLDGNGLVQINIDYADINRHLVYKGQTKAAQEKQPNPTPATVIDGRVVRDVEALRGRNHILITFDDGPAGNTTRRLLDELAKRDVRVTFFALGSRIEMYPDIIQRAFKEGHTVASHGYSHRDMFNMEDSEIIDDINRVNTLILNTIGVTNRFVRPPYGNVNQHILSIAGVSFVNWNIDPEDWKYHDADVVYNNIMAGARNGAISLSHDLYETTVDGVIRAIDSLLAQGYALISLEEAIKLGLIDPNTNQIIYSVGR